LSKFFNKFKGVFGAVAGLAVAISMLVPAVPALAADSHVSVSPSPITVNSGDDFEVYLDLSIGAGVDMDTLGFQLDWSGPAGSLTCTDIVRTTGAGSFFDGFSSSQILEVLGDIGTDNTTSQFSWAIKGTATPNHITGPHSGHIATLSFHADTDGEVTIQPFDVQVIREGNGISYSVDNGTVYVGGQPDLVVLEKHENWVDPGNTYNITYTIKNQGAVDADASYTAIKIDDAVVLVEPCSALLAEETEQKTVGPFTFNAPSDEIEIFADTDSSNPAQNNLVTESDETNNSLTNIWSNNRIYFDPSTPTSRTLGQTVDVKVDLASMTDTKTAAFKARWDEGDGELTLTGITEDTSAGSFFTGFDTMTTGGDASDPTYGMDEQYAITLKYDNLTSGDGGLATLHFLATGVGDVDLYFEDVQIIGDELEVIEVIEAEPYTINIGQGDFIDIVAVSKSERFDIESGQPVYYVDFTVSNDGNQTPGEGCQITIYENGEVLEVIGWSGAAGETLNGTSGPWPVPATLGDTEIKLFADSRNDAIENNEDNNILINTLPYLPNLRIVDKWEVATAPGEYQVFVTVKNLGPVDCTETSFLGIYRDGTLLDNSTIIPALASGVSETLQYPSGTASITMSGVQDIVRVVADDTGLIIEWNEQDNDREQIYSYIDDSCVTPITGQPLPVIEITCPGPIDGWYWEIGDNCITRTYNVRANTDWQVEAEDSDDQTAGYMTEWDGEDYYSLHLVNPLHVQSTDGGDYMTDRAVIKNGEVDDQNGSDGEDFDVEFCQEVEHQDPAYPDDGHVYHMEVTFIAGANF
jgi:hypothetical protein